jgi:uncharacterized protein YecE (DUF72 family)
LQAVIDETGRVAHRLEVGPTNAERGGRDSEMRQQIKEQNDLLKAKDAEIERLKENLNEWLVEDKGPELAMYVKKASEQADQIMMLKKQLENLKPAAALPRRSAQKPQPLGSVDL